MNIESEDVDDSHVLHVGNSSVFHFVLSEEIRSRRRKYTVCGNATGPQNKQDATKEDPEEIVERGKTPCRQCVGWMNQVHDIYYYCCDICERFEPIHGIQTEKREIPHMVGGDPEMRVCSDCINTLK